MLVALLSLLFINPCACENTGWPPRPLPWQTWADKLIAGHLINMTAELIEDAQLKLEQAGKVQNNYKHSITYELGTIAAGIQDKYRHMLKVYRLFSNMTTYMTNHYSIYDTLNAYHILQGDYNGIKVEQTLFYDILRKHEEEKAYYDKIQDEQLHNVATTLSFMPGRGGGRRMASTKKMIWRDGGGADIKVHRDFDWK